ncbi:MAG: hypothetical protein LQ351_000708 [Letrouitia transgressa]|nr:MAG: hypothetical protein LQ351_000708 [Letrouitia transgressa]
MSSHLTRHVFRYLTYNALLPDTPFSFQQCHRARRRLLQPSRSRRSIFSINFNLNRTPERQPKPMNRDTSLDPMFELTHALKKKSRPPSRLKLAEAFNEFVSARQKDATPIQDFHVKQVKTTLLYLQETYEEGEAFGLSVDDMGLALDTLKYSSWKTDNKIVVDLAKLLFEEIKHQKVDRFEEKLAGRDVTSLVRILGRYGEAQQARDLLEQYWEGTLKAAGNAPWLCALQGFASEKKPDKVTETVQIMEQHGVPFDSAVHGSIVRHYVYLKDAEMVKKWYNHPMTSSGRPDLSTDLETLEFCIDQRLLEWGEPIFKKLLESKPISGRTWNLIFQWAAAKGKGVDEIERMMKVMVRRMEEQGHSNQKPTIETINGLVRLANSKDDPYTAERFVALGQRWGIEPNADTYLLQMDYRIKVGDLDGAKVAFHAFKGCDLDEFRAVAQVNTLIVALCAQKPPPYNAIMSLADDLEEHKSRFEAATVIALCLLHLRRGETIETYDLVNSHAFYFSEKDRVAVCDAILAFIFDPTTSTDHAWQSSNILHRIFNLTIDIRTKLMTSFFTLRGRADFGTMLLIHAYKSDIRLTEATYVAALEGLAQSANTYYSSSADAIWEASVNPYNDTVPDPDNDYQPPPFEQYITQIHNTLKIDTAVEPSTRLRNALMLAYTAAGEAQTALEFWAEIEHSREGPSWNSILIALRACETAPFGVEDAKGIWARLKGQEGVDIRREAWGAYICALAGHGVWEEGVQEMREMEKVEGKVDWKL